MMPKIMTMMETASMMKKKSMMATTTQTFTTTTMTVFKTDLTWILTMTV